MTDREFKEIDALTVEEAEAALERGFPESARSAWHRTRDPQVRMATALQVLALVAQGKTLATVGTVLGMTPSTVMRYRDLAFKVFATPLAEQERARQLAVLDTLLEAAMPGAQEGDPTAAGTVLRVLERRAKLTGADAPLKADVQVAEVTQLDLALQDMIREARVETALHEQRLIAGLPAADGDTGGRGEGQEPR